MFPTFQGMMGLRDRDSDRGLMGCVSFFSGQGERARQREPVFSTHKAGSTDLRMRAYSLAGMIELFIHKLEIDKADLLRTRATRGASSLLSALSLQ